MKRQSMGSLLAFLVVATGLMAIIASGGGGGDGGGGGGSSGLTYTGETKQATINPGNAEQLAASAFIGGDTGAALGSLNALDSEHGGTGLYPSKYQLYQVMDNVSKKIGTRLFGQGLRPALTESDIILGDCGGSAAFSIDVDDASGQFSGSMTFNSYCDLGVALSGSMLFSGTYDVAADDITRFNFSFESVNVISGSESIVIRGTISMDATVSPLTVTMDFYMRDDTGQVFWINDYRMSMVEGANSIEFEISGRFYHPSHGYVVLMTTDELVVYADDDYPSAGTLVLQGASGTQAELTAIDNTKCLLKVDLDGDGQFDWNTGTMTWDDLVEGDAGTALPTAGSWSGTAGFGKIGLVVSSAGTGVAEIKLTFENFSCGGVKTSGSITFTNDPPWPISSSQLTADLDWGTSGDRLMNLSGAFDRTGTYVSGSYEADFNGIQCSGIWNATPGTGINTLNWIDGKQTLISYQYSRGLLTGMNFYRKFDVSDDSSNLQIRATLKADSSNGATIDSQDGSFSVVQGNPYTVKVHVNVLGRGRCSPFDKDVMVFSSPSAASTRITHIYPTIEQNDFYCISNYAIDTITLE